MSPRTYSRERRAAAAAGTRHRIVAAAVDLHARQGSASTSWDDIATAAGVSRATVYNHFRSLDELIPACAGFAFAAIDAPSAEQAAGLFAGLTAPADRVRRLIVETCRCYAAGSGWLRTAWAERDFVPPMGESVRQMQAGLAALLDVALEGAGPGAASTALIRAALDFSFWDALVRAGHAPDQVPHAMERVIMPLLQEGAST